MSVQMMLSEIPQRLYPDIWAQLRAHACSEVGALTYLNAPYPDEDSPSNFFFGRSGSFEEARHCYCLGRQLLNGCRDALIKGSLRAVGSTPDGQRTAIRALTWGNLWPMFATNWASGPETWLYDVQIIESDKEFKIAACAEWLRRRPDILQKKSTLLEVAKAELGTTHRVFNEAYKAVRGLPRGRPRKR